MANIEDPYQTERMPWLVETFTGTSSKESWSQYAREVTAILSEPITYQPSYKCEQFENNYNLIITCRVCETILV